MTGFPAFPAASELIAWWARVAPTRVALVDWGRGDRITYAQLDERSERWAHALRSLGVTKGDRVAVLAGNRPDVVELFYGCLRIGAVLVPLNWRLAGAEVGRVLADAAPAAAFVQDRFRALAESAHTDTPVRWIDLDREAPRLLARAAGEPRLARLPVHADEATMLLYTSGSTGKPKGAILPHRQLHFNAVATAVGWQLGPDDIAVVANPFFHTGGWHVFATPLWHRGGTIVLLDGFDPSAFLDALHEERCTVAFSVPTQIMMLTEQPAWGRELPSLRFLISGGAPCPHTVASKVRAAGIRFREGYGLTECGPNCFTISDDDALARPGSVGWPMPFLEMKLGSGIADRAPDHDDVAPGEVSELLLRGPQMFGGYFNDPARTAEAVDTRGWLRTGDLASRDDDGAYTIRGRKKDMFISGGENVFPGEVEAALAECDGVAEVVVIGVPDERWGEVGRAFVVRRAASEATAEGILAQARERLARYKVPKSVVLLDELPRLGSGKADRRALAALTPDGATV